MSMVPVGDCLVTRTTAGMPVEHDNIRVFTHFCRGRGAEHISLRVVEFGRGVSAALVADCEAVLYCLSGAGVVFVHGWGYDSSAGTAIYVRPGAALSARVDAPDPLVVVLAHRPDPTAFEIVDPEKHRDDDSVVAPRPPVTSLTSRTPHKAGDRWFRFLVDHREGSTEVTQYACGIPPGRAADRELDREEVLCVLSGTGRLWSGDHSAPIERGSLVFVPRGASHALENTGTDELRVLGTFYPAGLPATVKL